MSLIRPDERTPDRAADGRPVAGVPGTPALQLSGATLAYGSRVLWRDLDLTIPAGQLVAVLGPNGSGKTSLMRVLLGLQPLTAGTAQVGGVPVRRCSTRVGYIPQKVSVESTTMVRARDVVRMGIDGHRWGLPLSFGSRWGRQRRKIDELLTAVAADSFADAPVSMLSGGELQRIRIAGALASDPALLLCDEPLAALDLRHQQEVAALIDERRRVSGTAVLFVTHDVNPILDYVDQVLYLAGGRFRLGPPDEVLTSEVLTDLYGVPVEVLRAEGRVIVVSSSDLNAAGHHHHEPNQQPPGAAQS